MFQTKHIPRIILKINLINLAFTLLFFLAYWIFLLTGSDIQQNRSLLLILASGGIVTSGIFILILAGAAVAENIFRQRFEDYQFVCLNRFGPSINHSFFGAQLLMTLGFGIGASAFFVGLNLIFRILG